MPIESAADFNAYLNTSTGHGVTATFFEIQNSLWDSRLGLIDTWYDIDTGDSKDINIVIDQEYLNIAGGTIPINGYEPRAYIKATDVPYISHNDKLLLNAITTNNGNTLVPETMFVVKGVEPDNVGMITLVLEEE